MAGKEMWCIACLCPVDFKQISTAKGHLKGAKHLKNKQNMPKRVNVPGPAAELQGAPEGSAVVAPSVLAPSGMSSKAGRSTWAAYPTVRRCPAKVFKGKGSGVY